jgi:hypothetical protein
VNSFGIASFKEINGFFRENLALYKKE